MRPKKRYRERHIRILSAMRQMGGTGTITEIADKTGLNAKGVSRSLDTALSDDVVLNGGRGDGRQYKLESLERIDRCYYRRRVTTTSNEE